MPFSLNRNPLNKKKAIRDMRKGVTGRINEEGKTETHLMEYEGDISKNRGKFVVYPSIAPKPGKEKSTSPDDWESQSPEQAAAKGELIEVKSRRRAEKLAAGSWKKGIDRREAMAEYRENKKIPIKRR